MPTLGATPVGERGAIGLAPRFAWMDGRLIEWHSAHLHVGRFNVLVASPPLVVTENQIDEGVGAIDDALAGIVAEAGR